MRFLVSAGVFNGVPEDTYVVEGETIQVPTVEEGVAALANAGITPGSSTNTTTASSGVSHTVQTGESLSSAAAAKGITIEALASANGLSADQIGGSYGWSGTIPSEWWHVQFGW